jgi:hypothetical protein
VERAEIAVTKLLHRPDIHWRSCEIFVGCSCGNPYHPCPRLAAALEAEQRMTDSMRNAGRHV